MPVVTLVSSANVVSNGAARAPFRTQGQMMPGKGGGMPAMPMGQMMMCLRHDGGSGGMNLGEVMKA